MDGLIDSFNKYLLSSCLLYIRHCPGYWGKVGNRRDSLLSWWLHSGVGGRHKAVNKEIPQIMSEITAIKIIKHMMTQSLWSDQWEPF